MTATNEIATRTDIARLERQIADLKDTLARCGFSAIPEWMSVKDAAALKGVSEATVNRWIREGSWMARGAGKNRVCKAK
jgi:predicted site-specific integrase-resolvase